MSEVLSKIRCSSLFCLVTSLFWILLMSDIFSAHQADMQVFNFTTMNCPIYFRQIAHDGEVRCV